MYDLTFETSDGMKVTQSFDLIGDAGWTSSQLKSVGLKVYPIVERETPKAMLW